MKHLFSTSSGDGYIAYADSLTPEDAADFLAVLEIVKRQLSRIVTRSTEPKEDLPHAE